MTAQDLRSIRRQVNVLREQECSFTERRVRMCSVGNKVSEFTVRRALNSLGYGYRRTRKKGLLTNNDLKLRLAFARKMKRMKLRNKFWTEGISFYLDATGFIHKQNSMDQACTPKAREWRQRYEGLSFICTAKGSKEGNRQVKFIVAVSYNRGVIICNKYTERMNGQYF